MSQVFANATIDRIAAVVQSPIESGATMNAVDYVHHALENDLAAHLKQQLAIITSSDFYWYNHDRDLALQFVSFAGMIELGIQSGYVSLSGWVGAPLLRQALQSLPATEVQPVGPVDLHLLNALRRRFDQQVSGTWSVEDASFATFESYLHLTSRIRADTRAFSFLGETHTSRSERIVARDRSALLSPRLFAEAFATQEIGGFSVTDVAAGVAVLRYFEWLSEVLESLSAESELRADIVRHARWAHGATRVKERFDSWVEQMREWADSREEGWKDETWRDYSARVFDTLATTQQRLVPSDQGFHEVLQRLESALGLTPSGTAQEPAAVITVEGLIAQGRLAAARQLALADAIRANADLGLSEDYAESRTRVATLVQRCKTLAALGNVDAAAAIVAPLIPSLIDSYGMSVWKSAAVAIVAQARQAETRAAELRQMSQSTEKIEPPDAVDTEDERFGAAGEAS